jgi:hypothetical protein
VLSWQNGIGDGDSGTRSDTTDAGDGTLDVGAGDNGTIVEADGGVFGEHAPPHLLKKAFISDFDTMLPQTSWR